MKTLNWIFNGNYHDHQQVEVFFENFERMHKELNDAGKYAYNSDFEGKLGIADPKQEKTAIYLCQEKLTEKERQTKIDHYLNEGFKKITKGEGVKKFKTVVKIGPGFSRASHREFNGGKIVFKNGSVYALMPKRNGTRGIYIDPFNVLLAK